MDSLLLNGQGLKDANDAYDQMAACASQMTLLDLSNNYLKDFNVPINFIQLKILILDSNMITSIDNFPIIPSLENLSIINNGLKNAMSFVMSITDKYPRIASINTIRNPMNPGFSDVENYKRYKNTIKTIASLSMIDGMGVNDFSFVNNNQNALNNQPQTQPQQKKNMFSFAEGKTKLTNNDPLSGGSIFNTGSSEKKTDTNKTEEKKSHKMFENIQPKTKKVPAQIQESRKMFTIDESEEIDGTEFVKLNKRTAKIEFNDRILRKSDNLTKFNRKNHSEGNKHITNADL